MYLFSDDAKLSLISNSLNEKKTFMSNPCSYKMVYLL